MPNIGTDDRRTRKVNNVFLRWILIVILFLLLVSATYTWYSLTDAPTVNNLAMYVNSPTGLEIAERYDAEEWKQQLLFGELVKEDNPLKPCTYSAEKQTFYAADYGVDGRMLSNFSAVGALSLKTKTEKYYTYATLYARSEERVSVTLAPAVSTENGKSASGTYVIGAPYWNADKVKHFNGGEGAELSIRFGLKITPVDPQTGAPDNKKTIFKIYEPNCDRHINGSDGYVPTPSIDGTDSLVDRTDLICQTASSWSEAEPVQRTELVYKMGEFTTGTELFALEAGGMVRIDIFIWLEGQDTDCTTQIGKVASILSNIQFEADYDSQSGLQPIH